MDEVQQELGPPQEKKWVCIPPSACPGDELWIYVEPCMQEHYFPWAPMLARGALHMIHFHNGRVSYVSTAADHSPMATE